MVGTLIICLLTYVYLIAPFGNWLLTIKLKTVKKIFKIDRQALIVVTGIVLLVPMIAFSTFVGYAKRKIKRL